MYHRATRTQMDEIEERAMRRMIDRHGLAEARKCWDDDDAACATFDALMEEVANECGLTIEGWTLLPVGAT